MNRREAIKRSALISGFAVSGSMLSAMLQGCGGEVSTAPDWTPEFFTAEEAEQIAAMAEAIIPRTDTPGAKDVYVDRYIDMMVNNVLTEEDQQKAKQVIADLYGGFPDGDFKDASAEAQLVYLEGLDGESGIGQFRSMVIAGYFTSEEVGKNVLAYDPVPGAWIPCGDLEELTGGRNWSL
ncbi:MAG: gluconate 2-dehydrogenase subunit 3 family protein [Saprospiraceae bacterium]|nr:gluconate 2-dehydrogenase subunit 3 family protein [Lewinella sp.]